MALVSRIKDERWPEFCRRFIALKDNWERKTGTTNASGINSKFGRRAFNSKPGIELRCFSINQKITSAVIDGDTGEMPHMGIINIDKENGSVSVGQYCNFICILLKYEEIYRAIELREFDQFNQKLTIKCDEFGVKSYGIDVPLLGDSPSFDYVLLQDLSKSRLEVVRVSVSDDFATLQAPLDHLGEFLSGDLDIAFVSSGHPFATCHQALATVQNRHCLQQILFEENTIACFRQQPLGDKVDVDRTNTGELRLRLDKLSESQRSAVLGILKSPFRPRAYVVTGPPGSGKSRVLIEAAIQIHKRSTSLKTLICASSNKCADRLYESITETLSKYSVLRLKAGERFAHSGQRLLISTNIKSNALNSQKIQFDYVLVDEANHSSLAESLVPIRLVKDSGCIVLFGDPKQLGPVVQWQQAGEFGLNTTLLDQLLTYKQYQLGNDCNSNDHMTKLTECYRCDAGILATSNELFYNQQVKCISKTPEFLMNKLQLTGPVQLLPVVVVKEEEQQSTTEARLINETEATCCVDLVTRLYEIGLKPSQIGVIAAYKPQAKLIASKLNAKVKTSAEAAVQLAQSSSSSNGSRGKEEEGGDVQSTESAQTQLIQSLEKVRIEDSAAPKKPDFEASDCKVDTVTAFQGDERDVIIVSAVDASATQLARLNTPRRFNVAMSRAKWLLIIVGNPEVLDKREYWSNLLKNAKTDELGRWLKETNKQC